MKDLDNLEDNACTDCILHRTRTNIVIGRGNYISGIKTLLIGEAPGEMEDLSGLPFQGQSGALLDEVIKHYSAECYITNVVKCRPPDNRDPKVDEVAACEPYLLEQIQTLHPQKIITLGRVPFTTLFKGVKKGMPLKKFIDAGYHQYRIKGMPPIPVYPVYHPAYILRNRSQTDNWKANLHEIMKLEKLI